MDYPAGEEHRFEFASTPIRVYAGELWIDLTLRLPAAVLTGELALPIQFEFQACDEQRCLPPRTLALPCTIAVAP